MSYANLVMYGAVLPAYESRDGNSKKDEIINADDPANRELLHNILYGE